METFTVYQFSGTQETCVLPTSWVHQGQVKYDSKKASDYVKKGKLPYKKWSTYKVEPICTKLFDSYDAAYRAESILLEKSDLESTDIEAINNPAQILNKKRQRRRNERVYSNSVTSARDDESDVSSSENEIAVAKLPPLDSTINPNNETVLIDDITLTPYITPIHSDRYTESEVDVIDYNETPINTNPLEIIADINDQPLSLSTERQVNQLKDLIIAQNAKIDNLTALVTSMSKQLQKMMGSNDNNNVTLVTRWDFPMQTIDDIKELDNILKSGEGDSVKEFKSFILQLGGTTLKATIKCIIKELYSLELQQKVNYSGRENKFSTKDLIQTKLILEVMQRNANKTQVEAVNEYMYHLQHVTDRVRAMKK